MKNLSYLWVAILACLIPNYIFGQEKVHYSGTVLSNPNFHDGQLSPVVGVHNIQIVRANRQHPDASNGGGWTYNHQPMIAYWNGKFYVQYLSDSVDEHVPPSHTLLMTSVDGYHWSNPQVVFPPYQVPDGFTKPGRTDKAKNLMAVMHQRVGFYVSKSGRLYTLGSYGVTFDKKDAPNDGNGIGRVIREVKKDGKFGSICFIYFNHGMDPKLAKYPYYTKSKDKELVKACQEILANPVCLMQWAEEADRDEPLLPLKKPYQACSIYTLPDGKKVALWKHALTSISSDGGKTWDENVLRAKGFVNSNAKIWGQRLSDSTYATVYNPSEFRWPLGISLSADGLNYTTLNLVHGEINPMRYGGNYKSYGPQYIRGIQEGNGTPPDKNLWVTYSVNKEDIWVSRVPVPVRLKALAHAGDDFSSYKTLADLTDWNIYSPLWAPVSLVKQDGKQWLQLSDKDPYDYAKVERKISDSRELKVSFDLVAGQNDKGSLQIEFLNEKGEACSRILYSPEGKLQVKSGYRNTNMGTYQAGKTYHVEVLVSLDNRNITVNVDGKKAGLAMLFAPIASIERVSFRTGDPRTFPTIETPTDQDYDLKNAGDSVPESWYRITNFQTSSTDVDNASSILKWNNYKHYIDEFNSMEDENMVTFIPNSQSAEWLSKNIPYFDCPQKNFEEMYYFRWWTLRKHIIQTPVGYGMTEFLVDRTYADKYNLIACAIGHHIHESRWLRDPEYLNQIIHTWYRGNEGKPMAKMMKFSSWNIDAVLAKYEVDNNLSFLTDMKGDLEAEYKRWESSNRLKNGLYWQGDVQDGMEESLSGGRKKKYARPTINSYMYGNAKALSEIGSLTKDKSLTDLYKLKADTLKQKIESLLWNEKSQFFETQRADTLAQVREEIGFLPWYFNLPDAGKFDAAWKQVTDEKGFSAPYGLTTAERRAPDFRSHGFGKCEWDGAVWPFATSQTLTAMANFMNNYPQTVVTDSTFFSQMELYVQSQHQRGKPYVGEYLDETTGYWLMGDRERSRYYNHSTFNDLIITGLVGLRPRTDNTLEVNPLVPEGKWDYFCLDNVLYHGHNITIYWDKTGTRYYKGKGLNILVDGYKVGHADKLSKLIIQNAF